MEIGPVNRFATAAAVAEVPAPAAVTGGPGLRGDGPDAPAPRPSGEAARPAPAARDVVADPVRHQLSVDIETHKVVFQALDQRTGDVILQLPDVRSLRAYADQLRQGSAEEAKPAVVRLA